MPHIRGVKVARLFAYAPEHSKALLVTVDFDYEEMELQNGSRLQYF